MSTYNRVLLLGTLGQNPILKSTQNGKPFCRLSLATDSWKGGDTPTRTSWHLVHVFGKEAENASRYLKKGRQVLIEGSIENSQSEQNGQKKWSTWITAKRLTFLNNSKQSTDDSFLPKSESLDEDDTEGDDFLISNADTITH